jgi:hypothetical protein
VVAVALLAVSPAALASTLSPVVNLPRPSAGEWMGIYLLGRKAGYSFDRVSLEKRGGVPVVVAIDDTTLRATLGGKDVSRHVREERTYDARPHGRLVHFEAVHEGDGGNETLSGDCDRAGVHLVRRRAGQPDEKLELPPSADVVENADLPRLAAARRADVSGVAFDGQSLRDKPQKVAYLGEGDLVAGGARRRVARVSVTEDQGKLAADVAIDLRDGRTLQLKFGGALLAVPEPEALAKKLDSVDLFALTRVPIAQQLPTGVVPETITYEIAGLPAAIRPAPERQTYEALPDGSVAVTVRAERPSHALAASSPPPEADLRATPDIESDDPAIRALAKKITAGERDPFRRATKISSWVYGHVRAAYGASSDRATDVLRRREGDCTEHSLLAVALARAAGVPARLVHGLVYAQGNDGIFGLYWHEWVEVWAGQWLAIDPTFGQEIADATHIELGEGDQTDAVALMGQLKISVLERKPQ